MRSSGLVNMPPALETFQAIKDLTEAGAEIKHIDVSSLRRCVIYDDNVLMFKKFGRTPESVYSFDVLKYADGFFHSLDKFNFN
jgi:hypothetical protein